jgi:hypothetical protein
MYVHNFGETKDPSGASAGGLYGLHEPPSLGDDQRPQPRIRSKLLHDARHMVVDGLGLDPEADGHLLLGHALRKELQQLSFAYGQEIDLLSLSLSSRSVRRGESHQLAEILGIVDRLTPRGAANRASYRVERPGLADHCARASIDRPRVLRSIRISSQDYGGHVQAQITYGIQEFEAVSIREDQIEENHIDGIMLKDALCLVKRASLTSQDEVGLALEEHGER